MRFLRNLIKHRCPTTIYWRLRRLERRISPRLRDEDRRETAFVGTMVNPGDLCFDIGCHLGRKATAMLENGAKVVGVEPEPIAVRMLELEFGNDPDFRLVPMAVGESQGTLTLYQSPNLSMTSTDRDRAGGEKAVGIEVGVTTLDELIDRFGRPTYCKIDVEGHELSVFRGLSQPIPLISFEAFRDRRDDLIACLDRLSELGAQRANLTSMDDTYFTLTKWVPIPEFARVVTDNWDFGRRADIYISSE